MRRTEWLQETRKMRFEDAYEGWRGRRLTQEEAPMLPAWVHGCPHVEDLALHQVRIRGRVAMVEFYALRDAQV